MDTGAPRVKNHRSLPFNWVSLFNSCTFHSLRKKPAFCDTTTGLSVKLGTLRSNDADGNENVK